MFSIFVPNAWITMNYEKNLNQLLILIAIKNKIEKKYYSLNNFCNSHKEIEVSDLSKFLNGKKQWNYVKFLNLLMILDTEIQFSWYHMGGYAVTSEIRIKYDPYKRNNKKFTDNQ